MLSIPIIKERVEPIAREYNMKRVYLFGSYAKGIQTDESDVDLIVENPPRMSIVGLSGFIIEVKEALQLPVDIITLKSISKEFNQSIGKYRVLIYEEE